MRIQPLRLAVYVVVLCLLVLARDAAALPDLVAEVFGVSVDANSTVDPGDVVEGCAGAETGRTLINFSLRTRNIGNDDLVMGDPGCPDCSDNPGAACTNPLYICSEAHGHPHFEEYATAEVLNAQNQVVAIGHKQGFCLLDLECGNPQFDCGFQGITAGCADVYASGLPCQYVDITDAGLPDGLYTLRVTVDPENFLPESNELNNVFTLSVQIGAQSGPPPTCPVVTANDVPVAIPDMGSAVSSLSTSRPGTVERLRVIDLHGTHTFVGDLEFHLESPEGTDVTIMNQVCAGDQDFRLDLADAAPQMITCPPNAGGYFQPTNPFAPFSGEVASGTWTLTVFDRASEDEGMVEGWGLEICTTCGNGMLDAGEACDDGNGFDGDCCSANCQTPSGNGTPCDDPATCTAGGTCQGGTCTGGSVACDPCLVCQPPGGCVPPANVLCDSTPALASKIVLKNDPDDPSRDKLTWKWKSSVPVALLDFGSPSTVTDLTLCVFDSTGLKLSATSPAAGACKSGTPCWKAAGEKIQYLDKDLTPDGIGKLLLRPGDAGRASVTAKGKGANLGVPTLGLSGEVTVRLKRSGGPACWQARFPSASRNDAEQYKARVP